MALPPVAAACTANPALALPLSTFVTIVAFGFGLPAAISVFPTNLEVNVKDLEPEFHDLCGLDGKPVETVNFYKGL